MKAVLLFAAGHLLLLPLGAWLAFHPSLRRQSLGVRLSGALTAGAVGLTVEAMALTALGIRWTPALLCAPLLALSAALAWRWAGPDVGPDGPARAALRGPAVALASAASLLALAHLGASLLTERATSVDYVYFWGVKAARFAAARSIDPVLLGWEYFFHAVPSYPPLVPVVEALPAMLAGGMAWKTGPLAALFWFLGALPVVWAALRRRLPEDGAAAVAGFWTVALALSLVWSFSGGNGEAPLLFFLTVAGATLLCERPERAQADTSRALVAVALAGAALAKVEGLVGALLLVAGVALRDRLAGRPQALARGAALALAPAAAVLLWFGFQRAVGLPVGYAGHGFFFDLHFENVGKILATALQNLWGGTAGLSWIVPAAVLLLARSRRDALPAFALVAGTFAFLLFDYLHDPDPSQRIGWTFPRVTQSGLSLWILAAGVVGFRARVGGDS
ncbi:MAG TPA: hypothetical protein VIA45_05620 [Thermoanaerobaculia bacterium]|jgi:hypothetical protein